MTSVLAKSQENVSRLMDPPAFRSVLGEADERIVLSHLPADSLLSAATLLRTAELLGGKAGRIRWILIADDPEEEVISSLHSKPDPRFCLLDSWALRLLPEMAAVSDAVILGSDDLELLGSISAQMKGMDILMPVGVGHEYTANLPVREFDPSSPESLKDVLQVVLLSRNPPSESPGRPPSVLPSAKSRPIVSAAQAPRIPNDRSTSFLLYNDWGIGDELLLSAVAREIKRAHSETEIWIRSRYQFRFPSIVRRDPPPDFVRSVETIYQNAVLYGPASHSPFPGHLVQQMLDKFALDTGLKIRAQDVRPELEPVPSASTRRRPRAVVLHSRPSPRLPSKDWGLGRWERLSEILRGDGIQVIQVGAEGEQLLSQAEDLRGLPPGRLPEVLRSAGAVVSLVGLLMHLAAATRTPAVIIYGGREHPAIDGYPDQVHLCSGALPCRGRWGCHLAPDTQCPHGMRCMEELTPELVAREALGILDDAPEAST
jgi:hypothetical protein